MSLFPFSRIRGEQEQFLEDTASAVEQGVSLLAHAPTGVGKTAAALSPALDYALKNGKTVFFLTPKHSQHAIAIETLRRISEKHDKKIIVVDIIGKQWTCLYKGARDVSSSEFTQFCEAHKRSESCRFLNNFKEPGTNKSSQAAKTLMKKLKAQGPLHNEEMVEICKDFDLCPYEASVTLARSANVVICDYFHIFHPSVRKAFLKRMEKELSDMVLVIDEAHNLPERIRGLMSSSMSEYSISNAIKEAKALRNAPIADDLADVMDILRSDGRAMKENEQFLKKNDFVGAIESKLSMGLDDFMDNLDGFGATVLEQPNRFRSFSMSVSRFLKQWSDPEKQEAAHARILGTYPSQTGRRYMLSLRCLDPAIFTRDVFEQVHSSILMSGTLLPLEMYASVLGFPDSVMLKQYRNPFPPENRMVVMVKGLTTRYTQRSKQMYAKIARQISQSVEAVPGNVAVFFPSYALMESVLGLLTEGGKEILIEKKEMKKREKQGLYERFADLADHGGGVLFAVQAGSFSEGMDFPGRILDCAIVVGLPLDRPTLETEALINYYDFKFGKGWDYGYTYPAMNKALQAAGRCIRSETDRGAIILMDERFKWKNYAKCFPSDMRIIETEKPLMYLEKFFKSS